MTLDRILPVPKRFLPLANASLLSFLPLRGWILIIFMMGLGPALILDAILFLCRFFKAN